MRIKKTIPDNTLPCSTNYRTDAHPYYIVAPAYRQQSAGIRLLHDLCSLLNQMGYEAYVDSPQTSGMLWTPQLTDQLKIAHYKAGKTPIVVYPEVVKKTPMGLGQPVRYVLNYPGYLGGEKAYSAGELLYTYHQCFYPRAKKLYLPVINLQAIDDGERLAPQDRTAIAYYHNRYTKSGGKLRDFGASAIEISSTQPDTNEKTLAVLRKAKFLYCYEFSGIIFEATLCGCTVVMLPNPITLHEVPEPLKEVGLEGVAWGESPEEISRALATVGQRRARHCQELSQWQVELETFIQDTQVAAAQLPKEQAWPAAALDKLPFAGLTAHEHAQRAERRKYARINEQYALWMQRCTLREIDADIYAEHLASGRLPGIAVLIDHRRSHINQLADTLDSLAACLGEAASVTVVSEAFAPEQWDAQGPVAWQVLPEGGALDAQTVRALASDWVLIVRSGTHIAPQGLVEWALSTEQFAAADLVYADEDAYAEDGQHSYPNFKPDTNVELLRCTNYLGNAVLARVAPWARAGCPLADAGLYAFALASVVHRGPAALGHIDTVLSHSSGILDQEQENQEFLAASEVLVAAGLAEKVQPLERLGTWLVDYRCDPQASVSLVVPTGLQTGYLRSLVESLRRDPQAQLVEIILVVAPDQVSEVEYALSDVQPGIPVHVLELAQEEYCHGLALNTGIAKAVGQYVLVCDDDTEMLHANWLKPLLGIASQSDVACVAPRLVAHRGEDARVVGGPMVLGMQGTAAPYNGEEARIEEAGVFSRLQLAQDVGTVAGHCFLFARRHWEAAGGFNTQELGLWFTVLDFCLRLAQTGKRHVWTPACNVLHHGGKTIGTLTRNARSKIRLADRELDEKDALLSRWASQLANDACYNRHLSLVTPFDVESLIVVDWQPKRRERPRILAMPLTSGAGQYRIMEPLNALQDASLAQTCVVIPMKRGVSRILQPLELLRAAPDRLILQHSVDDAQLGLTEKYKQAMPSIQIIQMVDDLLGDVPAKHPSRNFQSREGHQRMIQALKQSDRLVVTTEPLRLHYQKYVKDVRLVPNALDKEWSGLRRIPSPRARLRVGWVGAAQHKGDLDLVAEVVRQTASEVDWVFMGMCTDEIKPLIKEFHGFVSIADYPKKMSELDLDIAIAPLESNVFNECKSNLRLLEYGAMGWPVVCSDVFPYRTDAPPVLRCGDDTDMWVGALRRLMADRELRLRMGAELHQWVNGHYALAGLVGRWKESLLD